MIFTVGETVPAFALICGSSLCQNCPHLLWDYQASENQQSVTERLSAMNKHSKVVFQFWLALQRRCG